MSMYFVYDQHATLDLKSLPRKTADFITTKIEWFASQDNPIRFAKKLNPPFDNLYRFRAGEYRVIFEITQRQKIRILIILRIKHRKDVY